MPLSDSATEKVTPLTTSFSSTLSTAKILDLQQKEKTNKIQIKTEGLASKPIYTRWCAQHASYVTIAPNPSNT